MSRDDDIYNSSSDEEDWGSDGMANDDVFSENECSDDDK